MKKKKLLAIVFILIIPLFVNAQTNIGLKAFDNNYNSDDFKLINKLNGLPKIIKRSFKKYNRTDRRSFATRFDEIKYEFIWAVQVENNYIVHFRHTGNRIHYHVTLFNYLKDGIEVVTYDTTKEVETIGELLSNLDFLVEAKSDCVFQLKRHVRK